MAMMVAMVIDRKPLAIQVLALKTSARWDVSEARSLMTPAMVAVTA
jgi:hypothetical protein